MLKRNEVQVDTHWVVHYFQGVIQAGEICQLVRFPFAAVLPIPEFSEIENKIPKT